MRDNYPLSSQELSDTIYQQYEHLVYLLGYEEPDASAAYSGLYDYIQSSGEAMLVGLSGIPYLSIYESIGGINPAESFEDVRQILKYDYIYKKIYGLIKYTEKI